MTITRQGDVDRLLLEAEHAADRAANKSRVVTSIVLLITVWSVGLTVPPDAHLIQAQVFGGKVTLAVWLLLGLAGMALHRLGIRHPSIGYVQVTCDALLIGGNLYFGFAIGGLAGNFWPAFPVVWLLPMVVGATALRWRPRLTLYAGVVSVATILVLAVITGHSEGEERLQQAMNTPLMFAWPPNAVRLVMLSMLVAVIVLVTWRGRALIVQAAAEARRREALGRHLPRQVLPLILDPALAELRRGSKRDLAVMFIDIRGSTGIAERIEPAAFAGLLAGFRRIVDETASQFGGVVDKFIGDGALVLFGILPTERDAASRAIGCARELLGRMAAFEQSYPDVRVGIGVHFGPVFVGIVGEGERVEFTALGEPVNVAARIEKATKQLGCRMLVSRAAVAATERPAHQFGLVERGDIRLEGAAAPQTVFAER